MSKLKRLATVSDTIVEVDSPFSMEDIKERIKDYPILSDKAFATKYSKSLFLPVSFRLNGIEHTIQYNFCINPFCKWFGKPQTRFTTVKNKPYRYKLIGKTENKSSQCNCDPIYPDRGMTFDCTTTPYSNWSIAQEIERLVRINSVKDIEPEYEFHKESCINVDKNPFEHPSDFYKRGKSKTGTQRWQCKTCLKRTNMMPTRRQTSTYNQKRNDILPLFIKLLVNKMPVSRSIDVLGIGVKTYYSKLEWVYRRCLEFLERHEQRPLQNKSFGTVWVNTDKMIYNLNNVRKKGMGGAKYDDVEDTQFPTHIVISADVFSRYVFRSDVAFDWDIRLEDIMLDTVLYKEDHLHDFARKHARLRFSYYPQEPSKKDNEKISEYKEKLKQFDRRGHYIDGLHTNSTYTTIAHYWLIRDLLKAQNWRFVTDNDSSLMSAMYRVFTEDFRSFSAHHFLCLTDREKSRKKAYNEYIEASKDLKSWGLAMGIDSRSPYTIAYHYLVDLFKRKGHKFHREIALPTHSFTIKDNNPIIHPLASIDRGYAKVDCTTDLSSLEAEEVARLILNVSDHATNFFIQHIRRKLSVLERPLTTARGDGKSYIYSNFNPKYAQMVITILRTYYNFCLPYKSFDKQKLTPAQRLGITDKQFKIEDILYLR